MTSFKNQTLKSITLYHLMIDNKKMIGIKFAPDRVIHALIKSLPNPRWSTDYKMIYLPNTKQNLNQIFNVFKGVIWINYNRFLVNKPISKTNEAIDISWFRNRKTNPNYKKCPEEYLLKLELKRYSNNTVRIYVPLFEMFINF